MAVLRTSRIRRLIALLLTWCFALAVFEAPIADVHDGGASHAEIDRVTGASHADHADVVGVISHAVPDAPAPDASDHPVHVCHCTHAHAGLLATPHVALRIIEHVTHETTAADRMPLAVALAPPTPPPIA